MDDASAIDAEPWAEYVAEGAANVIYRPLHSDFKHAIDTALQAANIHIPNPLLRLRKDLPHLPSVQAQFAHYNDQIAPLLPAHNLIPQLPLPITQSQINHLNTDLTHHESTGRRPRKRHNQPLAPHEPHALVIQDMAAGLTSNDALIELKPKWLLQSPNAPANSRRCRTCALAAMRGTAAPAVCPLDLAAGDAAPRLAATLLASHALGSTQAMHAAHAALASFLAADGDGAQLFSRLRQLQRQLDPAGVLGVDFGAGAGGAGDEAVRRFLLATTLRDCTLFVRVRADGGGCEGRVGDFDLKMAEPGKVAHWRGVEERLRGEGWYVEGRGVESGCALGRGCEGA